MADPALGAQVTAGVSTSLRAFAVSLCVGFSVSWALCDGSRNGVSCTSIFIAQKNEDHLFHSIVTSFFIEKFSFTLLGSLTGSRDMV